MFGAMTSPASSSSPISCSPRSSSSMNSTPASSPGYSPRYHNTLSSSTSSSLLNLYPSSCSYVMDRQTCAYPSWPKGSSLRSFGGHDDSSSFISDEDLFFDPAEEVVHESHATLGVLPGSPDPYEILRVRDVRRAPPKEFLMAASSPSESKPKKRRRSSALKKPRRSSGPLTPVAEAPE